MKDYLKVDPPVPGQNWVVLSFVSPEDMIVKRNLFYINHFLHREVNRTLKAQATHAAKKVNAEHGQRIQETLNKLSHSTDEVDKQVFHRLREIREQITIDEEEFANDCMHEYNIDYDEIHDRYKMYQSQNRMEMDQMFDQENKQATSVRGVKVRGVYNSREEAEERAFFVRDNVEQGISANVAQVGYWLAWDPDPDSVKDSRYQNDELNKLMGQYHENLQAKDKFFQERKNEKMEDAEMDRKSRMKQRLKEKLKQRKQAQVKMTKRQMKMERKKAKKQAKEEMEAERALDAQAATNSSGQAPVEEAPIEADTPQEVVSKHKMGVDDAVSML